MLLQIFIRSGLKEDSWILLSASAFNMLCYVILVKVNEENLTSHRYVIGKERNILIGFSDHYGYSLLLQPNSTGGSFLKVSLNVESETVLIFSFSYFVTLKSIGDRAFWTVLLPMPTFFLSFFFLMYYLLENISSLFFGGGEGILHQKHKQQ